MHTIPSKKNLAFTLIELLVVLAIVALLTTLTLPRYFQNIDKGKEAILTENLRVTRETIDKFVGDTGRYPESLDELVEKKYLKQLPVDPITESSTTWVLITPSDGKKGAFSDLRSGASGNKADGTPFASL